MISKKTNVFVEEGQCETDSESETECADDASNWSLEREIIRDRKQKSRGKMGKGKERISDYSEQAQNEIIQKEKTSENSE